MAKPTVYLIHGIRTKEGETTDTLRKFFEDAGYTVVELDYGYLHFFGARFLNRRMATLLAKVLVPNSIIVGHSNGCAIASRVADRGTPIASLIMIQPALNNDWVPPEKVEHMHVYFNERDKATWWSSWLVRHRWGKMGNTGPDYNDPRVEVTDTGESGHFGHSVEFEEIAYWGPVIVANCEKAMSKLGYPKPAPLGG